MTLGIVYTTHKHGNLGGLFLLGIIQMSGLTQGTRNVAMSALPRANAGRLSKSVVAERALGSRPRFGCPVNQSHPLCTFSVAFRKAVLAVPTFSWSLYPNFCWTPRPSLFFGPIRWATDRHLNDHNGHWAPHVVLQAGPHRAHRARRDTGAIHQATGEALGRRRRQGRAIRTCGIGRGLLGIVEAERVSGKLLIAGLVILPVRSPRTILTTKTLVTAAGAVDTARYLKKQLRVVKVYTIYCILYTIYYILYTIYYILYTSIYIYILYTIYIYILYTIYYILYTILYYLLSLGFIFTEMVQPISGYV